MPYFGGPLLKNITPTKIHVKNAAMPFAKWKGIRRARRFASNCPQSVATKTGQMTHHEPLRLTSDSTFKLISLSNFQETKTSIFTHLWIERIAQPVTQKVQREKHQRHRDARKN